MDGNFSDKDKQLEEILNKLRSKSSQDPMQEFSQSVEGSFAPEQNAPQDAEPVPYAPLPYGPSAPQTAQAAASPYGPQQYAAPQTPAVQPQAPQAAALVNGPSLPTGEQPLANEMFYRPAHRPAQYGPQYGPAPQQPPAYASGATGQINKRMLAPTIGASEDWSDELRDAERTRTPEPFMRKDPTTHPVFTNTFPQQSMPLGPPVAPQRLPRTETALLDRVPARQGVLDTPAPMVFPDGSEQTSMFIPSPEQPQPSSRPMPSQLSPAAPTPNSFTDTGMMDISGKSSNDEEFRNFFGETTVMEGKKNQRRPAGPPEPPAAPMPARVKQRPNLQNMYAPPVPEEAVEAPPEEVFDDDYPEYDEGQGVEYRDDNDTDWFLGRLMSDLGGCTFRLVSTGVLAAVLLFLNLAAAFFPSLISILTSQPAVFYLVCGIVSLGVAGINFRSVFGGFAKLVTFRADSSSVTSFAAIAAVLEAAAHILFASELAVTPLAAPVAALAVLASDLGERLTAKRILDNFRAISDGYEKYAAAPLYDAKITSRVTRELEAGIGSVLIKRKTVFTDDFMYHSFSLDELNTTVARVCPFVFIASLLCGAVAFIRTRSLSDVFTFVALAAAFSAPFSATIASAFPFSRMHKKLAADGTMIPGFSAVDEIISSNCVLVEGRDLFPRENVMLHGIKTFEKERIDMAILYAASVLIQSCDTLSGVFLNVIQNKTDILFETDGVVYEDGRGYSFWVGKDRVLLGTRELMSDHEIEVPSRDYENRYTKKSTRDALYLSVSGKLFAMFIVSYEPNPDIEQSLHSLEHEGVSLLVRTRDFNVTSERIARLYNIPRSMVSIVREADLTDLSKYTGYAPHTTSAMTFSGRIKPFFEGIISCYSLRSSLKLSSTVELASMLAGATVALALAVWGALGSIGMLPVLLFQCVWLAVTCAAVVFKDR